MRNSQRKPSRPNSKSEKWAGPHQGVLAAALRRYKSCNTNIQGGDINMILRRIIATDGEGWQILKLECGHEVGPIAPSRVPKKRKRCPHCENIADFKHRCPSDFNHLMRHLHDVPMDDRAVTLVGWITHITSATQMLNTTGCDVAGALWLTQQPSTYPLAAILLGDSDNEATWWTCR